MRQLIVLILLGFASTAILANGVSCVVTTKRVGEISIGDSVDKVLYTYGSGYQIIQKQPPGSVHQVQITRAHEATPFLLLYVDKNTKVLIIDVFGVCRTKEGVGVGSTLENAVRKYGKPIIGPSDMGYFVGFRKAQGITFLLDDDSLPKTLRGIPDDTITRKQEAQILAIKKARIKMVRVTGE